MRDEHPHRQQDVEDVILSVLRHGKSMSTQEVTRATKARLDLTLADTHRSNKRQNESKIDQIIANALQAERRLCKGGLIERVRIGEFRITTAGQNYLEKQAADLAEMTSILDELHPGLE